jgi:mRNA interferase MazF
MVKSEYQWNVFMVNLEPTIGSEQGKTRPVLVVRNEDVNKILPIVNIVPITSRKPERIVYPNEVLVQAGSGNLKHDSVILYHQIRAIDKKRIGNHLGRINEKQIVAEIHAALKFQLDLQ